MSREARVVDTNVFIRFLVEDDRTQAEAARQLMHRAVSGDLRLIVPPQVAAEIVYVLESVYDVESSRIRTLLQDLLETPGVDVRSEEIILQALVWYDELGIDFDDAYIGAWSIENGHPDVYTFNARDFGKMEGLTPIDHDSATAPL